MNAKILFYILYFFFFVSITDVLNKEDTHIIVGSPYIESKTFFNEIIILCFFLGLVATQDLIKKPFLMVRGVKMVGIGGVF